MLCQCLDSLEGIWKAVCCTEIKEVPKKVQVGAKDEHLPPHEIMILPT
jgi:hypothetical protein